jgi:hypothetical protein
MKANTTEPQISFELKDSQLKSIEASRQPSDGKLTIKTSIRAGNTTLRTLNVANITNVANFDCIFFARNAPFAPEHV